MFFLLYIHVYILPTITYSHLSSVHACQYLSLLAKLSVHTCHYIFILASTFLLVLEMALWIHVLAIIVHTCHYPIDIYQYLFIFAITCSYLTLPWTLPVNILLIRRTCHYLVIPTITMLILTIIYSYLSFSLPAKLSVHTCHYIFILASTF